MMGLLPVLEFGGNDDGEEAVCFREFPQLWQNVTSSELLAPHFWQNIASLQDGSYLCLIWMW